jgi:hypothetical protein
VPGKVTLGVFVKRLSDHVPLENAYACVGADADHPASFAPRGYTDSNGRVVFHVDPGSYRWYITADKTAHFGSAATYTLNAGATFGTITLLVSPGTGGPTCP